MKQESVKAEERLKAFATAQDKRQAEAAAAFSAQVTALEQRVKGLLPAPTVADDAEPAPVPAETEAEAEETKKKKDLFKSLF